MSIWTHVNGSLRVDAFRIPGMGSPPLNMGIQASFEDSHEPVFIPYGSEGSLVWTKWDNPSKSSLAAYTVTVFGDLRDYDNVKEIEDYLAQITKGQMIRSGVFEVAVEGALTNVYRFNSATASWDKVYTVDEDV